MTASMTGFALCQKQIGPWLVGWEIRSVNHRFLEIHVRMPEEFRLFESEARTVLQHKLKRGKVDLTFRVKPSQESAAPTLTVNEDLLENLRHVAAQYSFRVEAQAPVSIFDFLRWPGMITAATPDPEGMREGVFELLDTALQELSAQRVREGKLMGQAIETRLDKMEVELAQVHARIAEINGAQKQKLESRLAELALKVEVERLEQEVALLVLRSDVAEELDRLQAHIGETRKTLNKGGAVGRRLDFMMQELNREANTLASKSADSQLTYSAVELKTLIEQAREQVQNIE